MSVTPSACGREAGAWHPFGIDCDACRVECPVEAIFHEIDVPDQWKGYIELNAEMA
jgi:ferredoxin